MPACDVSYGVFTVAYFVTVIDIGAILVSGEN